MGSEKWLLFLSFCFLQRMLTADELGNRTVEDDAETIVRESRIGSHLGCSLLHFRSGEMFCVFLRDHTKDPYRITTPASLSSFR